MLISRPFRDTCGRKSPPGVVWVEERGADSGQLWPLWQGGPAGVQGRPAWHLAVAWKVLRGRGVQLGLQVLGALNSCWKSFP